MLCAVEDHLGLSQILLEWESAQATVWDSPVEQLLQLARQSELQSRGENLIRRKHVTKAMDKECIHTIVAKYLFG